ncbi:Na/Pi symporter [Xanthobacter agilis]|uniref:Phosphate:Na+ symporter n=1 Tax=Xanthobacter agilis TaxID=47492 RepID=A0ABU0LBN8_XANAG|nr:Na/Pi symporter [Xanthobacter agilis]MDQ0504562.1 phosphate:Na+ symporter [Xanthobacter agilis]
MSIVVGLLAGLGFIFIGTQFLTANMKQVAGPGFHKLVARATGHPLKAAMVGVAAGAIIQSTNAVTFIVISLVSAGAATVRSAMPIVTWSYAGSTLRLLLASFDIDLVIMSGIAVIGFAFLLGYDRDARYRNLVAAMLGLFLLLYGVQIMVQAAVPLRDSEALRTVLGFADRFYFWGFIAGTVLASVIQGQTVSVIAVALAAGGVLDIDQTFLIVVGANLGTGIMAITQGAGLTGTARQLNLYQLVLKLIGVAVVLPALTIEHYTGVPLIRAFITGLTADAALQVTAMHWLFQIVSALIASTVNGPLFTLLERWSPATTAETLAAPVFITAGADSQPMVAATLVAQEQGRLVHRLPHFLDGICTNVEPAPETDEVARLATRVSSATLREGGEQLATAIDAFLAKALQHPGRQKEQELLLLLWNRNQMLRGLHGSLATFAKGLSGLAKVPDLLPLIANLEVSGHAMLRAIVDELDAFDETSLQLVAALTSDRADVLRKLRQDFIDRAPDLSAQHRQALWSTLDEFEQSVWLLRRFAANLAEGHRKFSL